MKNIMKDKYYLQKNFYNNVYQKQKILEYFLECIQCFGNHHIEKFQFKII